MCRIRAYLPAVLAAAILTGPPALPTGSSAAKADTLTLRNGTTIYGRLEPAGAPADKLRIRTELGVIDLPRADVTRIEHGPPPWEEYELIRSQYPANADGQFRLGDWCRNHGLRAKARAHFEAALKLDPDHADARRALGPDRADRRNRADDGERGPAAASRPAASRPGRRRTAEAEEARLLRELTTRWNVRLADIYLGRLSNRDPQSDAFADGRMQILAIRDPLAIGGIASVLSRGEPPTRLVMVEALSAFREDEATMNLVAITMLDPHPDVRRAAAVVLARRTDERIIGRLRKGLSSDEDAIVRNAARALGVLKARSAVEDLAAALYTVERRVVRVRRAELIGDIYGEYQGGVPVVRQSRTLNYRPSAIGVLSNGSVVGIGWVDELQDVVNFRTDVQEALIAITGENFGFDADAWIAWARRNPARLQ